MYLFKRGKKYSVQFTPEAKHNGECITGTRLVKGTGETDERRAAKIAEAIIARANAELLEAHKARLSPTVISIAEACDLWLNEKVKKRSGKAWAATVGDSLIWIVENLGEATPVNQITEARAKALCEQRASEAPKARHAKDSGATVSGTTVMRSVWTPLKGTLDYVARKYSARCPAMPYIDWSSFKPEEGEPRKRTLSTVEARALNAAIDRDDYRDALVFALLTGAREDEVMTLADVDFEREFEGLGEAGTFTLLGKQNARKGKRDTKKERTLVMGDEIRALLQRRAATNQRLFFTRVQQYDQVNHKAGETFKAGELYPLTARGFSSWFDACVKRAGIEDFCFHDLRRTFATWALDLGVDGLVISTILGHSLEGSTTGKHYAHAKPIVVKEAFDRVAKLVRKYFPATSAEHTVLVRIPVKHTKEHTVSKRAA